MKNNLMSLLISIGLLVDFTLSATPVIHLSKNGRPTRLAKYQIGTYLIANGAKIRVNIDKQLGGRVSVQLTDSRANSYFYRVLSSVENGIRLSIDLTELADGDYLLQVSNGLNKMVRTVKITTGEPTIPSRLITLN